MTPPKPTTQPSTELEKPIKAKHKHPMYTTYHGMISRCYYSNDRYYARYGGRGIAVCDRWLGAT